MATPHDRLVRNLKRASRGIAAVEPSQDRTSSRRLRSGRTADSRRVRLQLVEVDGVLHWEETTGAPPSLGRFRRRGGAAAVEGGIADLVFEKLPPSQITQFLAGRDDVLTPQRNLRRWDHAARRLHVAPAPPDGRALVIVHGTFSNGDNFVNSLQATPHGTKFLARADKHYKQQVYVFDHATLSVGPMFNAVDLQRQLAASKAKVDLLCHSRGGLVARWWCETFDPLGDRCGKAILVGSPLSGTGLAAPPNLRATVKLLTNVGHALGLAAGLTSLAVPMLAVVESLLKVVTSVTGFAANTPLVDAVVAMIPGLFAQSRVGNNPELLRLLGESPKNSDRYHAVSSNFEPDDPLWAFWRIFRKARLADFAADVVFKGANDLVVDTLSMTELAAKLRIPAARLLDFGTNGRIHHMNYFDAAETTDFLADSLFK